MHSRLFSLAKKIYKKTKKSINDLFNPCKGTIYMLHRVGEIDRCKLEPNEHLKISPGFLDKVLTELEKKYDFISLSDVPERLKKRQKRKFVCFTMDDGYKDNYTEALPVFKKHRAPYTIFIATDFPDHEAILWWYELEDLILNNQTVELSDGSTYICVSKEQKNDVFLKIREKILNLNQMDLANELNNLFKKYNVDWTSKCNELCLSWEDIIKLKSEPLVQLGGHTKHHYNLKELPNDEDVKKEIDDGLDRMKKCADVSPITFAYPFGSDNEVGDREFKIIEQYNFSSACLAYGGECRKQDIKRKTHLPRVMLSELI